MGWRVREHSDGRWRAGVVMRGSGACVPPSRCRLSCAESRRGYAAVISSSALVLSVPSSIARANRSPPLRIGRSQSPNSTIALTAAHLEPGALPCVSPRRNSSTICSLRSSRERVARSLA